MNTIKGEFLCVVCPNGCSIEAEFTTEKPPKLISADGQRCPRGLMWVHQEIENPMRTIASNVLVQNGDFIAASVRTESPISLGRVRNVMDEIRRQCPKAPLCIGHVLIKNVADTGVDVIVTRNVAQKK